MHSTHTCTINACCKNANIHSCATYTHGIVYMLNKYINRTDEIPNLRKLNKLAKLDTSGEYKLRMYKNLQKKLNKLERRVNTCRTCKIQAVYTTHTCYSEVTVNRPMRIGHQTLIWLDNSVVLLCVCTKQIGHQPPWRDQKRPVTCVLTEGTPRTAGTFAPVPIHAERATRTQ